MMMTASLRLAARGARTPVSVPAPSGDVDDIALASRILIVEDELMIAWMIQSLLEDMGFTDVEIAGSSEAALGAATRACPALVISDINLGGGPDGIETARRIDGATQPPVLFVSAYAGSDERLRMAEHLPAATVLRKPIEPDALARAVRAMLSTTRSPH